MKMRILLLLAGLLASWPASADDGAASAPMAIVPPPCTATTRRGTVCVATWTTEYVRSDESPDHLLAVAILWRPLQTATKPIADEPIPLQPRRIAFTLDITLSDFCPPTLSYRYAQESDTIFDCHPARK